jgi:exonuclease VII small subunit
VGIGLLFAFIAAIEGIYWNDPYPRYTFLQKRLDKQLDYYKETYEDCLIELNEVKSKNLGTFEDIGNDLTRRLAQLQKVVSEYSRLNNLYENFLTHLQTASDSLHAVYRDANIEARPKKAYPKRWKKAPLITKIKLTKLTQVDEKKLDKKIKDVRKDLKGLIVQIQEEFESGLDQFKGLDELGLEAESDFGEKEKA